MGMGSLGLIFGQISTCNWAILNHSEPLEIENREIHHHLPPNQCLGTCSTNISPLNLNGSNAHNKKLKKPQGTLHPRYT